MLYDFVSAVDLVARFCVKLQRRAWILHPKHHSPVKMSITAVEAG
jgi:hypothetical protein